MNIEISKILDNPYQPRTVDNAEHIESLARSIAADGLLQVPTARQVEDHYQLAFGHSRRKAFEWLNTRWQELGLPDRYNGYWEMPVNVAELTDEEMYRHAVAENVQRKDLDAIEIAKAMAVYQEQFGKTSDEIGALFGMSGSTVRGKLRLLDLGPELQAKLSSGEISEGTARVMLSAQKLASAQDLLEAIEEASELPEEAPAYVVSRFISNMDHVKRMWDGESREGKPHSDWRDGWLLDMKKFPNSKLPLLTAEQIMDALRISGNPEVQKIVEKYAEYLDADSCEGDKDYHTACNTQAQILLSQLGVLDPSYVEKIRHLLNPPACSACPFYAVMEKTHYCGMRSCHRRKTVAWDHQRLEKMSRDMGIPIYQTSDGKFRLLDTYSVTGKALVSKKSADLRLVPKDQWNGHMYQNADGFDSELGWLVVTGEALKKSAEEKKQTRSGQEDKNDEPVEDRILDQAEEVLKWGAAAEVAKLFEGLSADAIDLLWSAAYGWRKNKFLDGQDPTEESQIQLMQIARGMVDHMDDDDDELKTAVQMLASLTRTCGTIGVKLPKGLGKIAAEFDAQIAEAVAAETEA